MYRTSHPSFLVRHTPAALFRLAFGCYCLHHKCLFLSATSLREEERCARSRSLFLLLQTPQRQEQSQPRSIMISSAKVKDPKRPACLLLAMVKNPRKPTRKVLSGQRRTVRIRMMRSFDRKRRKGKHLSSTIQTVVVDKEMISL